MNRMLFILILLLQPTRGGGAQDLYVLSLVVTDAFEPDYQ